jgi:hypothetical protein
MKKKTTIDTLVEQSTKVAEHSLKRVDRVVGQTTEIFDTVTNPVRTSLAQRYPTLFSLLITVGATATFLGFEQLLLTWSLLERYPLLILLFGVSVLAFTGTLYKKLQ